MQEKNKLQKMLKQDELIHKTNVLYIITSSRFKSFPMEIIDYLKKAFINIGIKQITVFYPMSIPSERTSQMVTNLGIQFGINSKELLSYLALILDSINCKNGYLLDRKILDMYKKNFCSNRRTINIINSTILFMTLMNQIGITVSYQPYYNSFVKLPFSGIYLINNNESYIIDCCKDLISQNYPFVQKMDEQNHKIINDMFHDCIENQNYGLESFDNDRFLEIHQKIESQL